MMLAAGQRRFAKLGTYELVVQLIYASQDGTGWVCAVESAPFAGSMHLLQTSNIGEQLDAEEPESTDDPHESQWQEVTWLHIGKRLLLEGAATAGLILAKAAFEAVFSRTYEDDNGRKRDRKTGRFTK